MAGREEPVRRDERSPTPLERDVLSFELLRGDHQADKRMLPIVGLAELNRLRAACANKQRQRHADRIDVFFILPLSSDYRPARAEPAPT
jgi:hypothetical protein